MPLDIAATLAEILKPVLTDFAQFGGEHAKHAIGLPGQRSKPADQGSAPTPVAIAAVPALPGLPQLPRLPSLAEAQRQLLGDLPLPWTAPPPAAPVAPAPALGPGAGAAAPSPPAPPPVADSYAAEAEDPSGACVPCTNRHMATVAEAAASATAADDDAARAAEAATIASELLIWRQYDTTAAKLAHSRPEDRAAISAIVPEAAEFLARVPQAPRRVLLVLGAVREAQRFAGSPRPSPADIEQAELRRRDVLGWIGYMEDSERAAIGSHLHGLRVARHMLSDQGATPAALAAAEASAARAAAALTPPVTEAQAEDLARRSRVLRDRWFALALDAMRVRRAGPPAAGAATGPAPRWHLDYDTDLPADLRRFVLQGPTRRSEPSPGRLPFGGALGATDVSRAAFEHLARFGAAIGLTERERALPATWEGVVAGAYSPDLHSIVFGPQVSAEDPAAVETSLHEHAHAVLHNRRCLPEATPEYLDRYAESIEEREADLVALLALARLGLPLELDDGTVAPAGHWEPDERALAAEVDAVTWGRVHWAAGVLVSAAHEGAGAAPLASACPVRRDSALAEVAQRLPRPCAVPVYWSEERVDHIGRHGATEETAAEVEEDACGSPRSVDTAAGVYSYLGRDGAGGYWALIAFPHSGPDRIIGATLRPMSDEQRRRYRRRKPSG